MEDTVLYGLLNPISKVTPTIPHLLYTDDVMFFLEANTANAQHIKYIINHMKDTTGH